jgi:hypothetical protein
MSPLGVMRSFAPSISLWILLTASLTAGEDSMTYRTGDWPESPLGNRRAVLRVTESNGGDVRAAIPWRRSDPEWDRKGLLLYDLTTGGQVVNAYVTRADRVSADLAFQAGTVPGEYAAYYMPYTQPSDEFVGTWNGHYLPPENVADRDWLNRYGFDLPPSFADRVSIKDWRKLPLAQVTRFEARGTFNRWDPMGVIAGPEETRRLLNKFPDHDLLLFPEDRLQSVRMIEFLPEKWVTSGPSDSFSAAARPGEYFTFQIGAFATRAPVTIAGVQFPELRGPGDRSIPAERLTCFNLGGIDWTGVRPFQQVLTLAPGKICPLWIGISLDDETEGTYRGTLQVLTADGGAWPVHLTLKISGDPVDDQDDSDPHLHSRMRWLNSSLATNPDEVPPPYTAVRSHDDRVEILRRSIRFGRDGLPQSIRSFGHELLAGPVRLEWSGTAAQVPTVVAEDRVVENTPSSATRESRSRAGACLVTVRSKTGFDGIVDLEFRIEAREETRLDNLAVAIPLRVDASRYMIGFGRRAGPAPEAYTWRWDPDTVHNVGWIGRVRAGLGVKPLPRDPQLWDMRYWADFDQYSDWHNDGRGGMEFVRSDDVYLIRVFTGPLRLGGADRGTRTLRLRLYVTPFKPLGRSHWQDHGAASSGAAVKHEHHATPANPYLNYPFLTTDRIVELHNAVKAQGMKGINLYYTCREISFIAPELFAWRSLPDQPLLTRGAWVYSVEGETVTGEAGGYPWLQEQLGSGYSPAWANDLQGVPPDAAVGTDPNGRLLNYYIEGVHYLKRRMPDLGIYIDGIGFGRGTSRRLARVLARDNPDYRVVYHTGNLGNLLPDGGYREDNRFCPMARHMEHLPYVTKLMFGEGFEFRANPDYWLLELSGLPFGLANEFYVTDQLNDTRFRPLLYAGCSVRHQSVGSVRRFFADWEIEEAELIGYWDDECPVRTGMDDVLASVYRKSGATLIAVASWRDTPVDVPLEIDYSRLGLDPDDVTWFLPAVRRLQEFRKLPPGVPVPTAAMGGFLLLLSPEIPEFAATLPTEKTLTDDAGILWGNPDGAGLGATAGKARALAGHSPGHPVRITAASAFILQIIPDATLRLAIYSGGSLKHGPDGNPPARLLCDFGERGGLKAGWNRFELPEAIEVPANSDIWVAWKGSMGLDVCYIEESPDRHPGFQTERGRWESRAIDMAPDTPWPASWPADANGSFGDSWYAFCLHMEPADDRNETKTSD